MLVLLAALFVLALAAGLVLLILSRLLQVRSGLPIHARVVYSDTGAWKQVERPLFSSQSGLTGKPDYLVEDAGVPVPVEVKPNRTSASPRESDVMQLVAYGILVRAEHGQMPPYGLLKYRSAVFQVDFTAELQAKLGDLMDAMRQDLGAGDVPRSHDEPPRCRACGYREVCGQALGE